MNEETKWKEHLHGGKGDNKIPSEFKHDDVKIGSKVEKEHTSDKNIEKEISVDHLLDSDTYYDELVMSGIADEKDAIITYNRVKTDKDKKKAIRKIQKHLNKEKEKLGMKEHLIIRFEDFINEKTHR